MTPSFIYYYIFLGLPPLSCRSSGVATSGARYSLGPRQLHRANPARLPGTPEGALSMKKYYNVRRDLDEHCFERLRAQALGAPDLQVTYMLNVRQNFLCDLPAPRGLPSLSQNTRKTET